MNGIGRWDSSGTIFFVEKIAAMAFAVPVIIFLHAVIAPTFNIYAKQPAHFRKVGLEAWQQINKEIQVVAHPEFYLRLYELVEIFNICFVQKCASFPERVIANIHLHPGIVAVVGKGRFALISSMPEQVVKLITDMVIGAHQWPGAHLRYHISFNVTFRWNLNRDIAFQVFY